MRLVEIQIDRLVGPTHHFGGLGVGNLASQGSAGNDSNPSAAAIQGLDKMRMIAELGTKQVIFPPQSRPNVPFLRGLGFAGTEQEVLRQVFDRQPDLLSAACSCSAMWTANAATVTPAIDSQQTQSNITIANLDASLHRAIEPNETGLEFRERFAKVGTIHAPLPGGAAMRDEGAANHMRLGTEQNETGIHLFVYGDQQPSPSIHWPRQTLAASQAIARLHRLAPDNVFFLKQNPQAIDSGAFHNDVVALSHHDILIHHQQAFQTTPEFYRSIEARYEQLTGGQLRRMEVSDSVLSLPDAVGTYLFNSQIISIPDSNRPVIICTSQVKEHPGVRKLIDRWCDEGLFSAARYVDLRQSMSGGGGPACLRLRMPILEQDLDKVQATFWSESIDQQLRELIQREYPTSLKLADLAREDFHTGGAPYDWQATPIAMRIVALLARS